jgi:hypothetical protein
MRNTVLGIAVAVFVLTVLAGVFNSQICVPCLALIAGAVAGYLAGRGTGAATTSEAAKRGAQAGALAGVGALLGHLVGGLIGAARLGPEGAAAQVAEIMRQLGMEPLPSDLNPATYYASAAATSLCFGLFEVAIMAGVGALAGMAAGQMGRGGTAVEAGENRV